MSPPPLPSPRRRCLLNNGRGPQLYIGIITNKNNEDTLGSLELEGSEIAIVPLGINEETGTSAGITKKSPKIKATR